MAETDLNEEAAAWVARLDRFGGSKAVQAEFRGWLAADRRRHGAFLRAEMAWAMLDRGRALGGAPPRPERVDRRSLIRLGAGSLAAASAAGLAVFAGRRLGETLKAGEGEFKRIRLKDGSTLALNANSEMHVVIHQGARSARLDRGEAWLQVAKDASRPFLVQVSDLTVASPASAFAVTRAADRVDVLVTEGAIELRPGRTRPALTLNAGSRAVLDRDAEVRTASLTRQEMDRALAWREGRIALAGDSLAQAIAAFNRYNSRKLVVTDPQLAGAKLDGWFSLDDPMAFARAAAESLEAEVQLQGDRIALVPRSRPAPT